MRIDSRFFIYYFIVQCVFLNANISKNKTEFQLSHDDSYYLERIVDGEHL